MEPLSPLTSSAAQSPHHRESMKSLFLEVNPSQKNIAQLPETQQMSPLNSIFSENHNSQSKGVSKNKQLETSKVAKVANLKNNSYDTLMQDEIPDLPLNSQRAIPPPKSFRASHMNNQSEIKNYGEDTYPSQDMKKLRLKISDYNKSPVIDSVCQKVPSSYF